MVLFLRSVKTPILVGWLVGLFMPPRRREGVVIYVGLYRRRRESVVKYVGPYRRTRESIVKYVGPYRRRREGVVKYVGPLFGDALEVAFQTGLPGVPQRLKNSPFFDKNVIQEGTVLQACQNSDSGRLAGWLACPCPLGDAKVLQNTWVHIVGDAKES